MQLGAFSVSLAVKDLAASQQFYANLGFTRLAGDGKNWLVLKNGDHVIGLFQGMFDRNVLTSTQAGSRARNRSTRSPTSASFSVSSRRRGCNS
jgi:hypothetical protein